MLVQLRGERGGVANEENHLSRKSRDQEELGIKESLTNREGKEEEIHKTRKNKRPLEKALKKKLLECGRKKVLANSHFFRNLKDKKKVQEVLTNEGRGGGKKGEHNHFLLAQRKSVYGRRRAKVRRRSRRINGKEGASNISLTATKGR